MWETFLDVKSWTAFNRTALLADALPDWKSATENIKVVWYHNSGLAFHDFALNNFCLKPPDATVELESNKINSLIISETESQML